MGTKAINNKLVTIECRKKNEATINHVTGVDCSTLSQKSESLVVVNGKGDNFRVMSSNRNSQV